VQIEQTTWRDDGWASPLPSWDGPQTLVLVFAAPEMAGHEAVAEVVSTYPESVVVGCSTSGEIAGDEVLDASVVVAVTRFDHSRIATATEPVTSADASAEVGAALGKALAGDDLRAVLVLSDGLAVNGTPLSQALSEAVGPEVVVSGGLAGDGDRFGSTWVLADGSTTGDRVVAVGMYGDRAGAACATGGGWEPFGVRRRVTRADGNVLHSLDDRPALELYKEYLGDRADGLPATALLFPLALRDPEDGHMLVRTVLSVDEDTQSMTFAGDLPEGAEVQLMRSALERLVDGAASAAEALADDVDDATDPLVVAISCVGRRLVLRQAVDEEAEATLEALPGATQVGFYSYGELSPGRGRACELHNQTMTLTAWFER